MSKFQNRNEKIHDILDNTSVMESGFIVPYKPYRYLLVEEIDDMPVFAYSINSLKEATKTVNNIDTKGISGVLLFDLDSSKNYNVVYKAVDWKEL